ncbi:hypothetical protein BH23PLA1_BH23PLA1_28920 [soil metagenome]
MPRHIGFFRALLNGFLSLSILGVAGYGTFQVAGRQWLVQETFQTRAEFASIGGVESGARVLVQGIDAGVVEAIEPPARPGDPVVLVLRLDARLGHLVRSDAVARIAAQGVVGAKVVEILPGHPEAPPLAPDAVLRAEEPIELADLMREASESLRRVNAVADAAGQGLEEFQGIAALIHSGEGTLGRLVRDEEAYDRLVRLTTQGEQTLDDLNENLVALKHTWPISRYFNSRSYFDRESLLYQPSADRESRTLQEAELFEPGRAVLTPRGQNRLDEVANWFRQSLQRNSEVVIAAFTDETQDDDLARVLTQEQAEAVRRYLSEQHNLESAGWFRSRKVAAVGFGSRPPRTLPASAASLPPRRVEIILFTPPA